MNELIKIEVNENNEQVVSGRELHKFLEVKSRFNDWFNNRIEMYGFTENVDFVAITKILVTAPKVRHCEVRYKFTGLIFEFSKKLVKISRIRQFHFELS